ncbi:MAG TPA: DUF4260 domain-containing protein [Flavobacteriaceae bacterium]|nr:DUF4260 domain-containing protein [Flavobacteriaceae bacterium]
MKNLIKIEELAMLVGGFLFFLLLPYSGWWFFVFFLVPDISMLGYLFGTKIGAYCYNLAHHRALAILFLALGIYLSNDYLTAAGCILFSHIAFDRILGYGLKYPDSFNHTHLGKIGRKKE